MKKADIDNTVSQVIQIPCGQVNAFLIQDRKTIIVDTGVAQDAKRILKKLDELGIESHDVSLIIVTHGHRDHFGGIKRLREVTNAPVAIHRNDVEALKKGTMRIIPRTFMGRLFSLIEKGSRDVPEFIASGSEILIEDQFSLEEYGVDGRLISTPGHTAGSVSVYLSSGEVIIGDMLMGVFRKKKPGMPWFADDMDALMRSIKRILELSPGIIYAGHGGPFTPESIHKFVENRKL